MEMKKLHMGTVVFGWDSMDEVALLLTQSFGDMNGECVLAPTSGVLRDGS